MPTIKTYFARVAKATSASRREEPINAGYSTPTTTRTMRTPVTTGSKARNYTTPKTTRTIQSPATSGKMRNYTKPTLIYRPLELDTESSSESSDDLLRHRNNRAADRTPLCLPAPPTISQQKIEEIQKPQERVHPTPAKKQPYPEDDDEIQIIEVINKPSDTAKTPNSPKRRKRHHNKHHANSMTPSIKNSPSVRNSPIVQKSIEIVQASQCMTPPITPERSAKELVDKAEKEIVPEVKKPTFIPGNCNIEEIMRLCGVKKKSEPGAATPKNSEAV